MLRIIPGCLFLAFIVALIAIAFLLPSVYTHPLVIDPRNYPDNPSDTTWSQLLFRIQYQPINLLFTAFFILATLHAFIAHTLKRIAHSGDAILDKPVREPADVTYWDSKRKSHIRSFKNEMLDFMGDVEVVYGLWCIPLFITITFFYDWKTVINFVNGASYYDALFMVVAMAVSATYPIVKLAQWGLSRIAAWGGRTPSAWWWTLLIVGPLLGSLIKETIAMSISAVLLGKFFFSHKPSRALAYATIALLFVNISVGGMWTSFGTSSIKVVAGPWHWDTPFMMINFGWKATFGIVLSTALYGLYFRSALKEIDQKAALSPISHSDEHRVPIWITIVHLVFLIWIVANYSNPVIALGSFVLFLGFFQATTHYQSPLNLKGPIMVGFFLASLVIHSYLQMWWFGPIVSHLTEFTAMKVMIALSAFTHNAVTNYMATYLPDLSPSMKYALFAGTMAGGGLTIMANAPNLVAYSLLGKYFKFNISFTYLFFLALIPTLIVSCCFAFL